MGETMALVHAGTVQQVERTKKKGQAVPFPVHEALRWIPLGAADRARVKPGWRWDGSRFWPPAPPPAPQSLEERLEAAIDRRLAEDPVLAALVESLDRPGQEAFRQNARSRLMAARAGRAAG